MLYSSLSSDRQAVSHGRLQTGHGCDSAPSAAPSGRRCQVVSIQPEMGMAGELMEGSVAQILHGVIPEGRLHAAL